MSPKISIDSEKWIYAPQISVNKIHLILLLFNLHAKLTQNITWIWEPDLMRMYFLYINYSVFLRREYYLSHDANSEILNMFLNMYQGYFSKQTRDQIYGHSMYMP